MRLHGAAAGERPEQRPGGDGVGPVAPADEHHRGDRGGVGVVVLAGVLEHLLHGAGRAREEDDAGVADLEQHRLAGRVAHVLRDGGGEHVGGLVAVVPGRDAEAVGGLDGRRDGEGGAEPGLHRRPERGHRGQRLQRVVQRALVGPRQAAAEVGGLHRTRPAAGGDDGVGAESAAQPGGVGVGVVAALHGMAAHHPDQPPPAPPLVEGVVDRVVVQGRDQRVVGAGRPLRPGVGAGVEGVRVPRRVVELASGVEPGAVHVERCVTHRRAAPARRRP